MASTELALVPVFEMLTERLSNVEAELKLARSHAQHIERRMYGDISPSVFGWNPNVAVERLPPHGLECSPADRSPTAPGTIYTVLVTSDADLDTVRAHNERLLAGTYDDFIAKHGPNISVDAIKRHVRSKGMDVEVRISAIENMYDVHDRRCHFNLYQWIAERRLTDRVAERWPRLSMAIAWPTHDEGCELTLKADERMWYTGYTIDMWSEIVDDLLGAMAVKGETKRSYRSYPLFPTVHPMIARATPGDEEALTAYANRLGPVTRRMEGEWYMQTGSLAVRGFNLDQVKRCFQLGTA
jgi:hypothetical protein